MTREELLKEMYEVSSYLMKKHEELKEKYGDNPQFESRDDRWAYHLLEELCGIHATNFAREFDYLSGYTKTVNEFKYRNGDGIRKVQETGQLMF